METINQEQTPTLSIVEKQKEEASKFVANKIIECKAEKNINTLDAALQVYEEVKGVSYREEQAVAKLVEFLKLQNETALRKMEIEEAFPNLISLVGKNEAVNDEKYDSRFLVAA